MFTKLDHFINNESGVQLENNLAFNYVVHEMLDEIETRKMAVGANKSGSMVLNELIA